MEVLSCFLQSVTKGLIKGLKVALREGVEISHLLFVNDTLLFSEADKERLSYIK